MVVCSEDVHQPFRSCDGMGVYVVKLLFMSSQYSCMCTSPYFTVCVCVVGSELHMYMYVCTLTSYQHEIKTD